MSVESWLTINGLDQYIDVFMKQNVEWNSLPFLEEEHLKGSVNLCVFIDLLIIGVRTWNEPWTQDQVP
jgi:hypothetical protein